MLRIDPTLNHVPARREHVVALYESINQPLVNIPNHGAAPTGAFLLGTRNEHGYYTVFVYLHQPETRAVLLYVSEPRNLSAEQYRGEEAEAVRFVESMGFMIDSVHFRQLSPSDQDAVMARVALFRPPVSTVDLYEVAEEVSVHGGADLFGALGAGADEMFRRAGLPGGVPQGQPIGGQPMGGPGSQKMRFGGPGTGPQVGMPQFAPPTPGAGLVFAPGVNPGMVVPQGMGGMIQQPQMMQQGMPQMPGPPSNVPMPASHSNTPGAAQSFQQPNNAQSPRESAESLERLGRFLASFGVLLALALTPALACKSAGTEVGPNPLQSQLDLGEQQLAERRFAEAIQTFDEVLAEDPQEKLALRGLGLAYNSLGRKEQAESYYRRALAMDPKWSEPKNELAGILIESRRCEEAEALLKQVVEDVFYATPEYGEHNLALALACEGRQSEAISRLEKLVLKRPLFCLGYLTLSQLSAQAKQPEVTVKACEDFDQHCAQNEKIRSLVAPEHTAVCYLRSGMAYAQMGDVESARASFMRCQTNSSAVGKECQRALEMLSE